VLNQAIEFIELPDDEQNQMRALPPLHDLAHLTVRQVGAADRPLDLPPHVAALVTALVTRLQDGERIAIVSHDQSLSAGEAGAILGLPDPLVLHRMNTGDLPYHYDAAERRVRLKDVMALKRKVDLTQAALDELEEETESLIRGHGP
jgi:hypothetical protein